MLGDPLASGLSGLFTLAALSTESDRAAADGPSDGVPPDLLEAAREAFTANQLPDDQRPPDSQVAVAVFDSLLDGMAVPDSHWLRFEHMTVAVNVHVSRGPASSVLSGEVESTGAVTAALHLEGASLAMVVDIEEGRFAFSPVGHGLVRLSIEESTSAPAVWTDWFRV